MERLHRLEIRCPGVRGTPEIPPILPLQKGGISPLWPPAHRASGPEGKEGIEEIFAAMCLFNYGFLSGA